MAERPVLALRARTVIPVSRPPIEDGAVIIAGNQIRAVGRWSDLQTGLDARVLDLGEAILLPGLINAHCHLDYTDMAGMLPPPRTFTDWIHLMLEAKAQWNYSEYARSWLNGARMLLRTGTTTVADIEVIPDLLPDVWEATPLRVFSFLEMTGIRSKREPKAILGEMIEIIDSLAHPRCRASLSPHAPYSTSAELLRLSARAARERKWPLCTHVAESTHEFDMFMSARGTMHNWLVRNQRDMSDCGLGSPVKHMARNKVLSENFLAVHVNALARGDASLLGKTGVNVVHCPRSHDYFKHPRFQRKRLAKAGANICLGTDSLATVRKESRQKLELNMFEEMRALAAKERSLAPAEILRMATINGAQALGMAGKLGELSESTSADIIAIPANPKTADVYETVLNHTGPVSASMIDGRWAIPPQST